MRIDAISIEKIVISRRWVIISAIAIVTLLAGSSISRINFDNSIESWFLESDPSLATYDRFINTFRADQIVVVGVFADDIFDPDILGVLDELTFRASDLEFVERLSDRASIVFYRID